MGKQVKQLKLGGNKNANYVLGASERISSDFINKANGAYKTGQVAPIEGDSVETAIAKLLAGFQHILFRIKGKQY